MQKVAKKYALVNSYFKNRYGSAPSTPYECFEYWREFGELPFTLQDEENWLYHCFCEYQKRNGVYGSQFFTPPRTAWEMSKIAHDHFFTDHSEKVLDACSGFGMLSKELIKSGFDVEGFDQSYDLSKLYKENTLRECYINSIDEFEPVEKYQYVMSNPPYEIPVLTLFFERLHSWLKDGGIAILLIPQGFIDKTKPKQLVENLSHFEVIHKEKMGESFERTNIQAEIVVLEKI